MGLLTRRDRNRDAATRQAPLAAPLAHFHAEIDRLFDRFFREPWAPIDSIFGVAGDWMPSLDMTETDREITVRAELPGVDPKDLDVSITGDVLTISGEKKESSEQKGENYYHAERRFGSFRRAVQLPCEVDTNNVTAEHANGVVTIRLQKSREAEARRVQIKVK